MNTVIEASSMDYNTVSLKITEIQKQRNPFEYFMMLLLLMILLIVSVFM